MDDRFSLRSLSYAPTSRSDEGRKDRSRRSEIRDRKSEDGGLRAQGSKGRRLEDQKLRRVERIVSYLMEEVQLCMRTIQGLVISAKSQRSHRAVSFRKDNSDFPTES